MVDNIEIHPYPQHKLSPEGAQFLAEINERIAKEGAGLDIDTIKSIFAARGILNIPDTVRGPFEAALLEHYGIEVTGSRLEALEDVGEYISLERFGVKPKDATKEYSSVDWNEKFNEYMQPHARGMIRMPFSKFGEGCRAGAAYAKAYLGYTASMDHAERVTRMSTEEWETYCRGMRWTKQGEVNEIITNALNMLDTIVNALPHPIHSALDGSKKEVLLRFSQFTTSETIALNSQLVLPQPRGHQIYVGQPPKLSLDSMLAPTQRK